MKKFLHLPITIFTLALMLTSSVVAQSNERKFEVGVQFTTLIWSVNRFQQDLVKGGGGRLAYNFPSRFAVDSEVNFLYANHPERLFSEHQLQLLIGLKAGLRKPKFGVFGKARPGFVVLGGYDGGVIPALARDSRLQPALDLGGIGEYYPSERLILRLDVGDTIINRFNRHSLQTSIGVGFRF